MFIFHRFYRLFLIADIDLIIIIAKDKSQPKNSQSSLPINVVIYLFRRQGLCVDAIIFYKQ